MTDAAVDNDPPKPRRGRTVLLSSVVAIALGGGAFGALYLGLIPVTNGGMTAQDSSSDQDGLGKANADIAFVPLDPMIISLGASGTRHLRLTLDIEVPKAHADDVAFLKPRILDVLNTYLRALDPSDFEQPAALMYLRAQMLRRLQIAVADGMITDLLVIEFVLS